jgi:two-component system, NarL family, invasion response regulator UvrY
MSESLPEAITAVLADDHNIVREGLVALCSLHGIRVLGQCADGGEAVEAIRSLKPDVAIVDMNMPILDGAEVVRRLRAHECPSRLIILSISSDVATVREVIRAGADAYLLKDSPSHHLLEAIQCVREGGVYVSPSLRSAGVLTGSDEAPDDPLAPLSPREVEVFSHLVNGLRAKDIAELLNISPKTVDTYRASLMRKLNVRDLVGLVKFAIGRNLTSTSANG